jgi:hypothetical protein
MTKIRHVTAYRDRHGKLRHRFRKTGAPSYHFDNEPGTSAFEEELAACRSGLPLKKPRCASLKQKAAMEARRRGVAVPTDGLTHV